jgi:peptidoglycan/LPS O-acetylase OafA/YrhL
MQLVSSGTFWISTLYQRVVRGLTSLLEGKSQKSNIAALDGVRGLACLSVVAYHITLVTTQDLPLWNPTNLPSFVSALAFSGDTGVNLFFILSGFLLFMPYARAMLFEQNWPSIRNFYIRRALRILPAYYVSLFLMILLFRPEFMQPKRLGDLFMFLILFMDSSPTAFKAINGPFWTLAVEWQFYLLLPLLAFGIALLVRRLRSPQGRLVLLALCLGAVMIWGIATRYIGVHLTLHPSQTYHLPHTVIKWGLFFFYGVPTSGLHGKYLEDFAIGMLISALYIFGQQAGSNSIFKRFFSRISPLLFLAGIACLMVMIAWKYTQRDLTSWPIFAHMQVLYMYIGEFNFGVGYGLCVAAILFGANWLIRPFAWTPLRWIGLLSYGLYMWHLLLLESFTKYVVTYLQMWKHLALYFLYWGWVFVFILPAVLLLFALVEKPWIQLGDRLTRKNIAPRPTVPLTSNMADAATDTSEPQVTHAGQ